MGSGQHGYGAGRQLHALARDSILLGGHRVALLSWSAFLVVVVVSQEGARMNCHEAPE